MIQELKNHLLKVVIDSHGAELQSIQDLRTNHEFLYQGNTQYWSRRSPVLFPIVGSVWNGKFRMDGKEFAMGQHGFARDSEFALIPDTPDDEAWFALDWNEHTFSLYPRKFRLEIGYKLYESRLTVMWRVKNLDDKDMDFHFGAHPAFNYPDFDPNEKIHGYFLFDKNEVHTQLLKEKGCIGYDEATVALDSESMLPITGSTFDIDTIILADQNVRRVSLLDSHRRPYLSVLFNAPVVGMWSPSPEAPFVCIEPWWGRADRVEFTGDFSEREYVNTIGAGETFSASYMIILERL
ncbi:MAG: aldose 1-epimerase family protein [Muribaculaceae bacterium]|nr:aldose 1-epimerase family protein [Muribaculaceae bacterium]